MIFFVRFSSSTAFSIWQPERMWVLHAITCLRLKVATLPKTYVLYRRIVGQRTEPPMFGICRVFLSPLERIKSKVIPVTLIVPRLNHLTRLKEFPPCGDC